MFADRLGADLFADYNYFWTAEGTLARLKNLRRKRPFGVGLQYSPIGCD